MTECANEQHKDFPVRHLGVYVQWRDRKVFVEHSCAGGHTWMEPAKDVAAVLAKVGLSQIEAERGR